MQVFWIANIFAKPNYDIINVLKIEFQKLVYIVFIEIIKKDINYTLDIECEAGYFIV